MTQLTRRSLVVRNTHRDNGPDHCSSWSRRSHDGERSRRHAGAPNKKALVGSWLETVTFPPESGRPPLKSLVTFHDDETMVCSDQGTVTTEPPSVFSSCHGVWTHLEQRTFAYTVRELISDLSGNLVGYLKVRGIYTVSQSGNEYTGTSFARYSIPTATCSSQST